MKKSALKIYNKESGMTLIEVSIALIVIGLLTIAFLDLYKIQQQKKMEELQDYKVFTIADGLARFLSEHQHYPCPARRDRAVSDSDYGATTGPDEDSCNNTDVNIGECKNGYCVTVRDGKRIRIGALPYKAMGIGKEDVIDVYGNQFTYAVVEDQATKSSYVLYDADLDNPPGTIEDKRKIRLRDYEEDESTRNAVTGVTTAGSDITRPVEMVFFSHGEGGAGSYTANGVANGLSCSATSAIDKENCDNDADFVTDLYAVRSSSAVGVADDKLTYNLLKWIYIWDTATNDSKSIYNRDSGNMGIGLEDGDEKLHVVGNLRVDAGGDTTNFGKVQTKEICDESQTDCFRPVLLGGKDEPDDDDEERIVCPTDFYMSGIKNGKPVCVSILGTQSANCSGPNQAINSLQLNATTGAITVGCANLL